jgi:APA family basic amino acid/polyamine antiporter
MLVLFIYMLSYVSLMGLIPPESLQVSNSPFADGAFELWGNSGKYIIGIGAIISTFGALNGWILLQGQVPYAIARDKLFPKVMGKVNRKGAPVSGLIISSIFITVLIASSFTKGLVGMFTFMILLTTVTVIFPYLFSSLAEILILIKMKGEKVKVAKPLLVGVPAFMYLMWVLTGVGKDEVYYGLLLILTGIPFYVWVKKTNI